MTEAGNTYWGYLCGAFYIAAGLLTAGYGVASLHADQGRAMLALPGGIAIAIAVLSAVREHWRQNHIPATSTIADLVSERQATAVTGSAETARSSTRQVSVILGSVH
ncbi:hypothetical protein Acel_0010 [Acidothermus cellulolyticus 11B]|jgi:hypothetical protein|uniref:Uncharacterized protein n=1 Tax=Acidothermus cellulolyticus (strain ATCC 43068 / DSM 8971 / 11B) TaxID=351607 RepID=A0LQS6_ACIC1|nr:hypothetical protein [Acidothermus cellulolyticus]ABK51786.1 hypothetical protein Acel_0010 [Acidothermus cellulolyticus 11B]